MFPNWFGSRTGVSMSWSQSATKDSKTLASTGRREIGVQLHTAAVIVRPPKKVTELLTYSLLTRESVELFSYLATDVREWWINTTSYHFDWKSGSR